MSAETNTVLSAQEQAIASGKIVMGKVSERVLRMTDKIRAAGEPRISLERSIAFTESFKTTEGQPILTRWGKALLYMAEHLPVTILDDELIVGRVHDFFGRSGPIWCELDASEWSRGASFMMASQGTPGVPVVTAEDQKVIDEVLTPYWSTRDFCQAYHAAVPADTHSLLYRFDPKMGYLLQGLLVETASVRSSQQWVYPYEMIMTKGCKAIKAELQARIDALATPNDLVTKKVFLESVIMGLDALVIWAKRFANLASEMAAKEKNAQRKQELEEIASVCAWVPENPARSFREACQVQWFIQLFTNIEKNLGGGVQCGRLDQYLYPYYKKAIDEGKLTPEGAEELLQCIWLNMGQQAQVKMTVSGAAGSSGYAHHELVVVGGLDANGQDVTNELTYVIINSARPLPMAYPDLGVRVHANTPGRLMRAVADMIKDGKGNPKLFNDEGLIPFYLALGCTPEEANAYVPTSCCDFRCMQREVHVTGNGGTNMAGPIELVLRNGKMKRLGDRQFGLQTGDPRKFATYEDVWKAYVAQTEFLVKHGHIQQLAANEIAPLHLAGPLANLASPIAMEACLDLHDHVRLGAIPGVIDLSMVESVGLATALDSLAAIKHLIYDTKKLTWNQLLEAIEADWEGHEAVRQMCVNAPKYGNGIEWVDKIGWDIQHAILDYNNRNLKPHGQRFTCKIVPVTYHIPLGAGIHATPNGRRAGEYLSDGVSPSHGMDVKGPTTTLRSMARAHCTSLPAAGPQLVNMKFPPSMVAGEAGTTLLMQVIRAWVDTKLYHIQFNVLTRETMLAAMKDPEKYRDLVVRVAGYSAFFTDLSPAVQAEVIARTEQQM